MLHAQNIDVEVENARCLQSSASFMSCYTVVIIVIVNCVPKIFPNLTNAERCHVEIYMKFAKQSQDKMKTDDSPF